MSNHGGTPYGPSDPNGPNQPNDPTSFGLQPPQRPQQPQGGQPQGGQPQGGQGGAQGSYDGWGGPQGPYDSQGGSQGPYERNPHAQPTQHSPYPQQPHQPQQPPHPGPPPPPQPSPPQQQPGQPGQPSQPGQPQQVHAVPTQAVPQEQAQAQAQAQTQAQTQPDPGTGRLVAGRYRLLAKLGHGGMGTVWRAKDETVDREVAVKEPRVSDHLPERERANAFERMRREARAAARLDHPSVVNVHDVAVEDGQPWIVMEFVQGRSLGDALQEGTLGTREAARIGLEMLGALEAAHQAGILHRDVKPDNVMLGRHDRVVLTDFGIAQIEGETNLTDTGSFVGSPEFIAPERVLGQRPGPASDLWSLGVVLYAATEGVSPFRRNNTPATLQSVLNSTPAPPATATGPLATAINQLLAKDPNQRANAHQVRQLLEAAAKPPAPTRTVNTGPLGSGQPTGIDRKAWLVIAAVVAAAAVTVTVAVADPFAGSTSDTESWKTHELKGLDAGLSLPPHYVKTDEPESYENDKHFFTYSDPSGAIHVRLSLQKKSEDDTDEISDSAAAEAYDDAAELRKGTDSLNGSVEAKVTTKDNATYKERKAAENTATYADDSDDIPAPRESRIFYYRTKGGDMYKLMIDYPGKGDFTERGREVAQAAIENLKINKL